MRILKILGIIIGVVLILALAGGTYVNFALPNTGPAPDLKVEATAQRIERGRYLANHVSVCMDCHSKRDFSLFSGPPAQGTFGMGGDVFDQNAGFPGKIYASNITPHNLENWSDGDILKAITTGQSKDARALFPVMSYSRFGKMDLEDIYSIIAYLRSLPKIANQVPATQLNFPVNLINKTLPHQADFQKIPAETDSIKYGAYLVNAAGCMDCHSQTKNGEIIKGTAFGGGMEFKQPAGIIRSTNITMHAKYGLGSWTKEQFIQRFKAYADSTYRPNQIAKTELNTPMPWMMFAGMTKNDLGAIYNYLKSLKPLAHEVETRTYNK